MWNNLYEAKGVTTLWGYYKQTCADSGDRGVSKGGKQDLNFVSSPMTVALQFKIRLFSDDSTSSVIDKD